MKSLLPLLCALMLAFPVAAGEGTAKGVAEIAELGRLNGQALACAESQAAARIKALMIDHAPKVRNVGSAFEEETNQAFLAQSKDPSGCQSGAVLILQAEEVAKRLQAAFPVQTPAVSK